MPYDSPVAIDGDSGFIGFASRPNPMTLPAGVLQESVNMRLDRGVARVRKGAKRLADSISAGEAPLVLPVPGTLADNRVLRDSYTGGIFGAGVFASQNFKNAKEFIVLAGPDRVFLYNEAEPIIYQRSYPSGETIEETDTVSVIQAYDRLYVLREAAQTEGTVYANKLVGALAGTCTISIASPAVITRTAHSLAAGMAVVFSTTGALPTGLTAGTIYYVISTGLTADTFRVSTSVGGAAVNTSGSQSGTHTVTPVSAVVSGTTATIFVEDHGYLANQRVRIERGSNAAFDGHEYEIASASTHSFTITVPSGTANDTTTAASRITRIVKPPIYWEGGDGNFVEAAGGIPAEGPTYKRMRSVGWAAYINGRMLIPDGRDQVMVSDIGNPDLYDPYWASFKANEGSSDYIVAIHPWVEGSALIFMRRSIWLAEINDLNVANGNDTLLSRLTILTDEIGCSARKSIATAGQFVYFLSDAGVYRLDSKLDLKLRGDTKPLSDAISDQLATIDAGNAANAVGLWYNNRYYLAFQAIGQDNQRTVFVYNALNEAWESKDILVVSVDDLLVTTYGNERRLFTSSRTGKLFLLEEREDGDDAASSTQVIDILAKIRTRRFNMGTMTQKRFLRSIADVVIPDGGQLLAGATTYNPDEDLGSAYTLDDNSTVKAVVSLTNSTGSNEDYHIKAPLRQKAHAAELTFYTNGARPEIRAASIEAAMAGLPQTDTKNVA